MTTEQPVEKPKRKYNLEEKRITNQIIYWLKKLEGCWYYKIGAKPAGMFGSQKPGIPDLYCCYLGRHLWFEIKKPGGTLQPVQREEIAKMQGAGAEVYVIRSLAEVKAILLGETA